MAALVEQAAEVEVAARVVSGRYVVGRPGIYQGDPALLEIGDVSGRQWRVGCPRDGGELAIGFENRSARGPAGSGDRCIGSGGGAVEGQHPSGEVLSDHRVNLAGEAVPSTALRQDGRAGAELRLADSG